MTERPRILYCHCNYAQVIPKETKEEVLRKLCASGLAFDAVADLCEMSARRDPALNALAQSGKVKVVACYPRAVKWLFASARAPLALDATEVLNMRAQNPQEIMEALQSDGLTPNLPAGKITVGAPEDGEAQG